MKRIYHTWEKWECYRAGFYNTQPPKCFDESSCQEVYRDFLSDCELFGAILGKIIVEWKNSCEHYLTNENMNRIAWLGQAALAYHYGIPSRFRGGYNLLTDEQKKNADLKALEYLNVWLGRNGHETLTLEAAQSKTEANLY
jgi:hypothetical protein